MFEGCKLDTAALKTAYQGLYAEKGTLLDFDTVWQWYRTKGDADSFPPEFQFAKLVSAEDKATMVLFKRFVLFPSA